MKQLMLYLKLLLIKKILIEHGDYMGNIGNNIFESNDKVDETLRDFLCVSEFYNLKDLYNYEEDRNKILQEIPSYKILIIFLREISGYYLTKEVFYREIEQADKAFKQILIDKAFDYFGTILDINIKASNNFLKEIQHIFDKYLLEGKKDSLIPYFRDKMLTLRDKYQDSFDSDFLERNNSINIVDINIIFDNTVNVINKLNYYIALLEGNAPDKAVNHPIPDAIKALIDAGILKPKNNKDGIYEATKERTGKKAFEYLTDQGYGDQDIHSLLTTYTNIKIKEYSVTRYKKEISKD